MSPRTHLRLRRSVQLALCATALSAPQAHAQDTAPQPAAPHTVDAPATKPHLRAAETAYLAGARKLEKNDLPGAEADFAKALTLDPARADYRMALAIAREHRLTALVHQATDARRTGDPARADTLIAEARAIDPENPILLEHTLPMLAAAPPSSRLAPSESSTLTDRARLLAGTPAEPWRLPVPVLAPPIALAPTATVLSFHLNSDSQAVLREVAAAYGIRTVFDDDAGHKQIAFDVDNLRYDEAMPILMSMAHVFAVPLDPTSALFAKDDIPTRARLERQVEETIYLPGLDNESITSLANLIRNVFEVKQATVQPTLQNIVIRAPADIITPLNRTLTDLIDGSGEVMLEVKLYALDKTRTRNVGASLPTQFGAYNVDAAATDIVNANQTLVQQGFAQGLIPPGSNNIVIALALIGSGLVQSSLLSNTLGFIGTANPITATGITVSGGATFNLALNSSDARALDDVQMRIGEGQTGIFRAGTKYPITTSTYSTGLSTAASAAASTATINGVSVASLLAQYAGGSSATIPQVSYEDLGVTLKATPTVQKSGRISLKIDLKIEALAGGSANGIPVLANRQIVSAITVGDGESALMASNLSRTESAAVSGIARLSELPGFQAPTDVDAEKDSSELVVVVTPHIVKRRTPTTASPRIVIRAQEPTS